MKKPIKECDFKILEKEFRILSSLDHPNIIKAQQFKKDRCFCKNGKKETIDYSLLEYAPEGDVFFYISRSKGLSDDANKAIIKCIINGKLQTKLAVQYCHSKGIIHNDLKAENILMSNKFIPKLCDFGNSVEINSEEEKFTKCKSLK